MNSERYLKYFTAIAIALSLQLSIKAQTQNDSWDDTGKQLSSPWENAALVRSLESTTPVNAIEFSPDGQLLASVGASQITLWNPTTGKIMRVLPGHYASDIKLEIAPTAIAFSPDSRFLATSTWSQGLLRADRAIVVRDVTTGEVVLSLAESNGCKQILFDVSGKTIYGACGVGITAWSFPDGKKLFDFASASAVEAIALSPDGIMATVNARVTERQQKESDQIQQASGIARQSVAEVSSVEELSQDSRGNLGISSLQLWQLNASKPELLKTLDGHVNDIAQLEFTPNGAQLVSSSYDGKIKVWNWRQGTISRKTNNLYSNEGIFSLSANGQLIAGNFHSANISSLVTGLPLRNTLKLGQKTSIMAFSPQNQLFARVNNLIDRNSAINLWSVDTSQAKQQPNTTIKNSYRAIPVSKYWRNQEHQATIQTDEPQRNKPISIGKDPQAIALAGLGLTEVAASQEVKVEYVDDNLATVNITQTNLVDDSVASKRYLIEFAPYGEATAKKWQIVWAGEQFKCQSGRGHQDWNADLCL